MPDREAPFGIFRRALFFARREESTGLAGGIGDKKSPFTKNEYICLEKKLKNAVEM